MEQAPRVGAPSPALPGQCNRKARNYPKKALKPISAILMSLTEAIHLLHTPKGDSGQLPLSPISHLLMPPLLPA